MMTLNMTPIEAYQKELADKAVGGDREALTRIGKNYGCFTWTGKVDEASAMRVAKNLLYGIQKEVVA